MDQKQSRVPGSSIRADSVRPYITDEAVGGSDPHSSGARSSVDDVGAGSGAGRADDLPDTARGLEQHGQFERVLRVLRQESHGGTGPGQQDRVRAGAPALI